MYEKKTKYAIKRLSKLMQTMLCGINDLKFYKYNFYSYLRTEFSEIITLDI